MIDESSTSAGADVHVSRSMSLAGSSRDGDRVSTRGPGAAWVRPTTVATAIVAQSAVLRIRKSDPTSGCGQINRQNCRSPGRTGTHASCETASQVDNLWVVPMPRRGRPEHGDLLQGTLDLLILKIVATSPAHGHTIPHPLQHHSEDAASTGQ